MNIERAKEIVKTGLVWANWSQEQAEAFRTLLLKVEEIDHLKKENDALRNRINLPKENLEEYK